MTDDEIKKCCCNVMSHMSTMPVIGVIMEEARQELILFGQVDIDKYKERISKALSELEAKGITMNSNEWLIVGLTATGVYVTMGNRDHKKQAARVGVF